MTEILTESFCERCGTRYTFESSAPRRSRVGRVRTFSRGVKNFVMSDEASFEEAMADYTAARAIYENRPAIVEQREDKAFRQALAVYGASAYVVATIKGLDYSNGDETTLRVYEAADAGGAGGPGQ